MAEATQTTSHTIEHNTQFDHSGRDADRLRFVVSGLADGVEQAAIREVGQIEFDQDMARSGSVLRRMARGIVKGNFLREAILLRNRHAVAERVAESGRLYDMDVNAWHNVEAESIQRVLDDEGTNEFINEHAGESRELLDGEKGTLLKSIVNKLVSDYVAGSIAKDDLQEEARRQFASLADGNEEVAQLIGAGDVYMSNIIDIAEAVKGQVTHERGIEEVLSSVDFIAARVNTGVDTEAKANRITQFLDSFPINSAIVSTSIAVAYSAGVWAGKGAISRATRFAGIGVGAGAFAYFQEKARLVHERAQVGREQAVSEDVSGTERRRRLAETLYEMKDATVLTAAMESLKDSEGKYEVSSQVQFDALLAASVDTSARYDMSATQKTDYIRFSSREDVPKERREMLMERFKAKAALRRYFDEKQATDPGFASGIDFDQFFASNVEAVQQGLLSDTDSKDEQYKNLSRQLAWKRARQTVLLGAAAGIVAQELTSLFNSNLQGVAEGLLNKNDNAENDTLLETSTEGFKHLFHIQDVSIEHGFNTHAFGHNSIRFDDRLHFKPEGSSATITGPDGLNVKVPVNTDGTLTDAAIEQLHKAGITHSDKVDHIPGKPQITEQARPLTEFMSEHGQRVHRGWFDNDTAAFDRNELRLSSAEVDNQGRYYFDAGAMQKGESFHDGEQATMDFAKYKLLISPSREVQATPLVIDVDSSGRAIISPDSPAARFFEMSDGKPVFTGRYAEMVQVNGIREDGSWNTMSLATEEGPGYSADTVIDQSIKQTTESTHTITLGYDKVTTLGALDDQGEVQLAFVPFMGRNGLRRNQTAPQARSRGSNPRVSPVSTPDRDTSILPVHRADKADNEGGEASKTTVPTPELTSMTRLPILDAGRENTETQAKHERERVRFEERRRRAAEQDHQRKADDAARERAERDRQRANERAAYERAQQAAAEREKARREAAEAARGRQQQEEARRRAREAAASPSAEQQAQSDSRYREAMDRMNEFKTQKRYAKKEAEKYSDSDTSPQAEYARKQYGAATEGLRDAQKNVTKIFRKLVADYERSASNSYQAAA